MSAKHLILIHGRSIKPEKAGMRRLALDAIKEGLHRANHDLIANKIGKSGNGNIKFSFAYYGHINNEIQADNSPSDAALLTDKDANGLPVFPIACLQKDFKHTKAIKRFNKSAYEKILRETDDSRFLDEIADIGSFFGSLFSLGILNTAAIRYAKPDMGEYLRSQETGSRVRDTLGEILKPAMKRGDDICLVAHSMGSMVSYDQLWKYSMRSEYHDVQSSGTKIRLFLTIGCPLGERGVRRNLLDARFARAEKYPRNIEQWKNFYARDDYISHVERMSRSFREMKKDKHISSIKDKKMYNCWTYEDLESKDRVSNPHDLYGYLMNQHIGAAIADWAGN